MAPINNKNAQIIEPLFFIATEKEPKNETIKNVIWKSNLSKAKMTLLAFKDSE